MRYHGSNENRTNVRKIFTINLWYVIIILSNGGKENDIIVFYKQLDECFATLQHII